MDDFRGPKILKTRYEELTRSIDDTYKRGTALCFSAGHGTGKSITCCNVLKRVVETGRFSALYVNLTDIVNVLLSKTEDKQVARKYLIETDFLVIDEFDTRFMGSDLAWMEINA
jgi:DNA replication protein DnaC